MNNIVETQDAFGRALLDYLDGHMLHELTLEFEDGSSTPALNPEWFFQSSDHWYAWEKTVLDSLKGPVLDLGCGAGRTALYLQEKGLEVTAIDTSPGAVRVCQVRGLRDVRLSDLRDPPNDKKWNSILLLCGNLGLAGGWQETRTLLANLAKLSTTEAVLVADSVDPTLTDDPEEIAYQNQQHKSGRYIGQVRLRLRYGKIVSPWWEQSNIAIVDLPRLVSGTGWIVRNHHINGEEHYAILCHEQIHKLAA